MIRLQTMQQQIVGRKVIAPVCEPAEWVNSLVITETKDESLRVCLDPCDLNKEIRQQHYSMPTPEEVQCNLLGKSIFTIFYEKDSYWLVKLDDLSSNLWTFNSPWGRYVIRSASKVFQQENCETYRDIEGVNIADDMIISVSSDKEHATILHMVMERAKKANVKFNKDNIQYKVDSVKYMKHVITSEGVKPDDDKVWAIVEMPAPEDKHSLQRLISMIRYLAEYIPDKATLTAPLSQLPRKDGMVNMM